MIAGPNNHVAWIFVAYQTEGPLFFGFFRRKASDILKLLIHKSVLEFRFLLPFKLKILGNKKVCYKVDANH